MNIPEIEQGLMLKVGSSKKKPFDLVNQREDMNPKSDQAYLSSANRLRMRNKTKSEAGLLAGNTSNFMINKEKPIKDEYKVKKKITFSFYLQSIYVHWIKFYTSPQVKN